MKWFKEIFLPSLEDRYISRGKRLWLTEKQVDICANYMIPSSSVRGCMYIDIGEKHYSIQIAPNGCAAFHVYVNGWQI